MSFVVFCKINEKLSLMVPVKFFVEGKLKLDTTIIYRPD